MNAQATPVDPRAKVRQVFQYLQALNRLRNPVVRTVAAQPWSLWLDALPIHPDVGFTEPTGDGARDAESAASDEDAAPLLFVRRPDRTQPPEPDPLLVDWLAPGWDDPFGAIAHLPSLTERRDDATHTLHFEEEPERVEAFARWSRSWKAWARDERPTRETHALFERLYALHTQLQRESGSLELLVGDGHLLWERPDGDVRHPVLLQQVELTLDPAGPSFSVHLGEEHGPELYEALLTGLEEVSPSRVRELREELQNEGHHPLGDGPTRAFLSRLALLLGPTGALSDLASDGPLPAEPRVVRRPLLFLRSKAHGMAGALRGILEDLDSGGALSPALLRIVGVDTPVQEVAQGAHDPLAELNEPADILLAKPSNLEQIQIASRLARHGSVLVQGPPGTGKTHTIGNLVGHLLAQGKSVLVASHETKALRVLRRQIPEALQPLCVSVLDDADSKRQLEASIGAIAARLSSSDGTALRREAAALGEQRARVIEKLAVARRRLLDARADEYRDVVLDGVGVAPSAVAREVAQGTQTHGWIPGPVPSDRALPLEEGEIAALYATNGRLPEADQEELSLQLPAMDALPTVEAFEAALAETARLRPVAALEDDAHWSSESTRDAAHLEALLLRLEAVLEPFDGMDPWRLETLSAGTAGPEGLAPWEALFALIAEVQQLAAESGPLMLTHAPVAAEGDAPDARSELAVAGAIREHLEKGRRLGLWSLLFRGAWRRLLKRWTLATGALTDAKQARAIELSLQLQERRAALTGRWDRQCGPLGAPRGSSLGDRPEQIAVQYVPRLEKDLAWHTQQWAPLADALVGAGLRWPALLEAQAPVIADHPALRRLHAAASGALVTALRARIATLRIDGIEQQWSRWGGALEDAGGSASASGSVRGLAAALRARDAEAYAVARARLSELVARSDTLAQRDALLARLEPAAPTWAAAIRARTGRHGEMELPGPVGAAWRWRRLHDELDRRGRVRLEELQGQIEDLGAQLRETTTQLIERMAWAEQVERSSLEQRQALMGWLGLMKRIGKGTGKRAPGLRMEASRLMRRCRSAVPVWIMTLNQAALSFDANDRFDVVIIDEASQSDVMALHALYRGREVVIVGDHEQVSPSAVGQQIGEVERLIQAHLVGIPNDKLYDGRLSVYELARQSFGGIVQLREHFRCVPDVIAFSNRLSYEGRILPLRDATSATIRPAVHAVRVTGAQRDGKVNQEEAETTTALIVAATRHPAYAGKSLGVISLVGDEQALLIEEHLRRRLSPTEFEARRLLCGNAAQFQGDERDVMFLSMVDSGGEGPLTMRAADHDNFKQRYNVAASRARDQLWVVHSVDPTTDLKAGDLRRLLLEHCLDPNPSARREREQALAAESPFEKEVLRRLVGRGYRVTPQWQVGAFRIDLVVEGRDQRLAVECDGDRFHPIEKLPEDMARQAILERLGWSFVRLRGSAFFRDPEAAMAPLFRRMEALGITPDDGADSHPRDEAAGVREALLAEAAALRAVWREAIDAGAELPSAPARKRGGRWGRRAG